MEVVVRQVEVVQDVSILPLKMVVLINLQLIFN